MVFGIIPEYRSAFPSERALSFAGSPFTYLLVFGTKPLIRGTSLPMSVFRTDVDHDSGVMPVSVPIDTE
jgi:hypothetical protein